MTYAAPGARRCKGENCGAPLLWALTSATGVAIPLDPTPNPDGNVVLQRLGDPPVAEVLGPLELQLLDPDTARYMPHHATCLDRLAYRKAVTTYERARR